MSIPFAGIKDYYFKFAEKTFFNILEEIGIPKAKIKRLFDISGQYFGAKMFDTFLSGDSKFLEIIVSG